MRLSVADRRTLMSMAYDVEGREQLKKDPRSAIADIIGVELSPAMNIELLEEPDDGFYFVAPYPGSIERDLPPPIDARSMIENDVYGMLRDEPGLGSMIENDPKRFMADKLGVDIGPSSVLVRSEGEDETILVMPNMNAREDLSDDLLDLISAGGATGVNVASQTTTPRPIL